MHRPVNIVDQDIVDLGSYKRRVVSRGEGCASLSCYRVANLLSVDLVSLKRSIVSRHVVDVNCHARAQVSSLSVHASHAHAHTRSERVSRKSRRVRLSRPVWHVPCRGVKDVVPSRAYKKPSRPRRRCIQPAVSTRARARTRAPNVGASVKRTALPQVPLGPRHPRLSEM